MRQNENRDILLLLTYLSEESIKQICEQYVYFYRTEEVLGLSFLMTTQCAWNVLSMITLSCPELNHQTLNLEWKGSGCNINAWWWVVSKRGRGTAKIVSLFLMRLHCDDILDCDDKDTITFEPLHSSAFPVCLLPHLCLQFNQKFWKIWNFSMVWNISYGMKASLFLTSLSLQIARGRAALAKRRTIGKRKGGKDGALLPFHLKPGLSRRP